MSHIDELDIVIRYKGGKVVAGIPQLSMYASGGDVQAAVTSLEQKRAELKAQLAEFGVLDDLEVRPYTVQRVADHSLVQFVLKTLIVIGLIAGTLTASTVWVASRVDRTIRDTQDKVQQYAATMRQYTKVGGEQFWEKAERELERAADPDRDLPAEKKQKLLSEIHVLVERWRPFIAQVAPLFADFQKSGSADASPMHSEAPSSASQAQGDK
jgi:hypothetical protein